MIVERIFIGGWFQRTTLHLSEIYDFLRFATSQLKLDKQKLRNFQTALNLKTIDYQIDGMEYLKVITHENIEVDFFEDGLIILSTIEKINISAASLTQNLDFLTTYYEQKLSPALSYLFSLGAPIPKELAGIKTVYPYFFVFDHADKNEIEALLHQIEPEKYFARSNENYDLFRGNRYYIVNRKKVSLAKTKSFIEEQIFLREFKGQLHRYLNIHRITWEKVDLIRCSKKIRGHEIDKKRVQIEGYVKTINLIESRMNQMHTYLYTREQLARNDNDLSVFMDSIEYRYETISATLSYTQDLWEMTKNHVNNALVRLSDLQDETTNLSIDNLTVITAVGVGSSLIGLFTATEMPSFTIFGIIYFVVLMILGFLVNKLIEWWNNHRKYDYEDVDYNSKIH